jgi:hypothetical protein
VNVGSSALAIQIGLRPPNRSNIAEMAKLHICQMIVKYTIRMSCGRLSSDSSNQKVIGIALQEL